MSPLLLAPPLQQALLHPPPLLLPGQEANLGLPLEDQEPVHHLCLELLQRLGRHSGIMALLGSVPPLRRTWAEDTIIQTRKR